MKRKINKRLNLYLCEMLVMKKLILVIFLFAGILNFAQKEPNRFEESEITNSAAHENELNGGIEANKSGNPAVPSSVSVDAYIPLLIMVAVGIIYYTSYRRNPTL